jgi:hypothetical protein
MRGPIHEWRDPFGAFPEGAIVVALVTTVYVVVWALAWWFN